MQPSDFLCKTGFLCKARRSRYNRGMSEVADMPDGERPAKVRHVPRITGIEKWRTDKFVEVFRQDCYRISIGLMELGVLLDALAGCRVTPELVPRLWELVPPQLRDQFSTAFHEAASPEFRLPIWVRGFPKLWKNSKRMRGRSTAACALGRSSFAKCWILRGWTPPTF